VTTKKIATWDLGRHASILLVVFRPKTTNVETFNIVGAMPPGCRRTSVRPNGSCTGQDCVSNRKTD
jgi:hypothetical protein